MDERTAEAATFDNELFRDAFNASPIGIAVENLEGRPLFVNPAFCSFLGFSEEEMRNKHCVDFSPREDAEKDWALVQQLRAGSIDHYQLEKRYFRRDGSLVWGSLSISLLNSRPSPLVLAMVQDITDKKNAEEARYRHAAVIESSDDAIASGTLDGIVVSWNAGAQKIYGYTEAEVIGKSINMLVPPELSDEENKILETLRAGGRIEQLETVRVTKTGKRINVSLTISPIKDSTGKTVGISGIARDITERKQAQEALRNSEEKFLKAFRGSPVAITLSRARDGRFIEVNDTFERLSGYVREEVIERTPSDIGIWVDPSQRDELRKRVLSGQSVGDAELRFRTKSGSVLTCLISAEMIDVGQEPCILTVASDITQRKQAEEGLRRSEAMLLKLFRGSPVAITVTSLKSGRFIEVSDHIEALSGYRREDLIGRTAREIALWFDSATREQLVTELISKGRLHIPELPTRTKHGDLRVCSISSELIEVRGEPCVISVAVDITERKQAEEALRAGEQRLRLAQSVARIGTFELNLKTGEDIWQPETEALYGLPPGGFGSTLAAFEDLIHPDDRERVKQLTQEMMRTGQTTNAEWRVVWPDGSVHWIAARCQVLPDASGERSRVVGVYMDVTERKQAEETLRESEERFRNVFRDAGVGMVIVSPEGRFLAANKAFSDLLGYTEEELLEKTVESVTLPEDWPAFSQKLQKTFTEGGFQWFEKRCLHKSGRIVYTQSSASVIRSREGNPHYLVGQVLDITERKEAEATVAHMSRKLIEAQEQERSRIGRELHDDINQRLALLNVELQQLEENPSEVGRRVRELRKRMTEISNDVQALSHDLHSSQLEYLGVVAGMKSWCKEFAERSGMQIECRHDVPSTLSREIGLCLFRVLQEALHNAAKLSGVKHVEVELREESGVIHLIVHDSGKGFDMEAARQGRGLGLTSMRERIRLANGTIEIQSKPMGGTTIHARVPLTSEHVPRRLTA